MHKYKMEFVDYSKEFTQDNHKVNHAPFFPKNIICVIAGATGCGKTLLMINLLRNEGILDYRDVYIYSSTLYQEGYEYLKRYYSELENFTKNKFRLTTKIAHFFEGDEEIKNPSEFDPKTNHIMIFDDVMNLDQKKIKDYFCRGRHNNINIFYLVQSLHKIAKHCIRENANVFILFHQDDKTLKYFHETHISGDMEFKEFKTFCDKAWSEKHGFVSINISEKAYCGRYIFNLKDIYVPIKYRKIPINTYKYL